MQKYYLTLLLVFSLSFCFGQDTIETNPQSFFWINGGFGFDGVWHSSISEEISINFLRAHNLFELKYTYNSVSDVFVIPNNSAQEFSLLYGRGIVLDRCFLGAAAGLSIENGIRRGKKISSRGLDEYHESIYYKNKIGIPVEAQVLYSPSKYVGIGLKLFTNFNYPYDFIGSYYVISIYIGKLR